MRKRVMARARARAGFWPERYKLQLEQLQVQSATRVTERELQPQWTLVTSDQTKIV